jgi:hypothetical protein
MKYSLILLFCISLNSYADIVVLNFNRNNSTVASAKIAAKKRGEKVIEYPKNGEKLNAQQLDVYMKELKNKGSKISSFIFSGHDGGGEFSGHDGSLYKSDVRDILKDYPEITKDVKSLVLRGCYTATPDETIYADDEGWQDMFPNLNMIAGYMGAAPSSERKHSKAFIQEVLELESQMYLEDSVNEIEKMFSDIDHSLYTSNTIYFKTCHEQKFRYLNKEFQRKGMGALSKEDIEKMCNPVEIKRHLKVARKYIDATAPGAESPPLNHQKSELRTAYSFLNKMAHCQKIGNMYFSPTIKQIIRLIYYDYIKDNFSNHYGEEMKQLKKDIQWYTNHTGKKINMIDLKTASRKEIKKFIHNVTGILHMDKLGKNKFSFAYYMKDKPALLRIHNTVNKMSLILDRVDEYRIPFDWVSSKKSPKEPDFYEDRKIPSWEYDHLNRPRIISDSFLRPEHILTTYFINHNDPIKEETLRRKIIRLGNLKKDSSYLSDASISKMQTFYDELPEASHRDIIRVAVRNPEFVSEATLDKVISHYKKNSKSLSPMDYQYFSNSHSMVTKSDKLKKQQEIFEKLNNEIGPQSFSIYNNLFKKIADDEIISPLLGQ